ncbi:MAG: response regulator [Leptolyngbyaceae cyanobacterium bins.349]|nr:response regulator [Leptolyngbyaceae cyanobacterium bins.349]
MPDQRITILCIDDNPTNRYVVQRHLTSAGFHVVEANSGEAGLRAIAQSPPDLIILDVRLPDISGFEVCQRLKENPATVNIPVLHLSAAYTRSEDRVQGLEMGADAYLVQPVEALELLATIRALLRLYEAERVAKRQSEEWQATFDAMNDGVCLLDAAGRVIRCNRAIETLLNQSCEALRNRHYLELVPLQPETDEPDSTQISSAAQGSTDVSAPSDLLRDRLSLHRLQQTGQRVRVEVPFPQESGQERWVAITLDAILNEASNFVGAVYIVTDITLQKRAEVERERVLVREQEARTASEAANRLKDEFLATLSHELRSPLNAILGWTKLLRSRPFEPTQATHALEIIERNTRAQTQLIEDLLDVSRIIQGKLRLKVQPTDLVTVIQAAIETVRPAAAAKSIDLRLTLLESEPPTRFEVLGDRDRLQQVIWNLLSNAVKFTPVGGRVEVHLERVGHGKPQADYSALLPPSVSPSYAQITVTDTGKGIPPEFLPHVFDRFRQADSSITRKYGGLGLGLSIVRHLVELHGGSVSVCSAGESQGATFTVQVPSLLQSNDQFPLDHTALREDPMPSLQGLKILVVDDEEDSRTFIATLLELYGATVLAVSSAKEVPQLLQDTPVDVLVSDIGMPDQDGYSLMQQVRTLALEQIPIALALTGYARQEDRDRALAAGFQAHLAKPIEPQALIQAIAILTQRDRGA